MKKEFNNYCHLIEFSCAHLEVKWVKDNIDKYQGFYSASGDGQVVSWKIVQGALVTTDSVDVTFTRTLEHFDYQGKTITLKGILIYYCNNFIYANILADTKFYHCLQMESAVLLSNLIMTKYS